MRILLTQKFEERDSQTPIAILDLAAYGRKFGRDIDVGYHEDMAGLDKYDWIWFSALTFDDRTLQSIGLCTRYHRMVQVGGKAADAVSDDLQKQFDFLSIEIRRGPGESIFAPLPIDYDNYPAWDSKDFRILDKTGGMTMMMTSRGCPYHCHFCHNTETKVSYFSPERTVANARLLLEGLKKPRVFFVDDIFALRPDKMMAILAEADRTGLELRKRTNFFVHISHIDDRRLEAIDAFQPEEMQVGIESGDDGMLAAMGKTFTSAEAEDKLRLLHSHGHKVACLFLMGFPGETKQSLQATVDFVTRNRRFMSGWWVSYYQPIPGTRGWDLAKERLGADPGSGWNTDISFVDPNITKEDLVAARKGVMG